MTAEPQHALFPGRASAPPWCKSSTHAAPPDPERGLHSVYFLPIQANTDSNPTARTRPPSTVLPGAARRRCRPQPTSGSSRLWGPVPSVGRAEARPSLSQRLPGPLSLSVWIGLSSPRPQWADPHPPVLQGPPGPPLSCPPARWHQVHRGRLCPPPPSGWGQLCGPLRVHKRPSENCVNGFPHPRGDEAVVRPPRPQATTPRCPHLKHNTAVCSGPSQAESGRSSCRPGPLRFSGRPPPPGLLRGQRLQHTRSTACHVCPHLTQTRPSPRVSPPRQDQAV